VVEFIGNEDNSMTFGSLYLYPEIWHSEFS